ncbi:hypothetical protein INT43_006840 [Umbelopsis isabellina]|uniref:Homeobox domain-containing protein n=1 Tax=Mortierella isabellina TaxID=91625 RepID=A0A8H7PXV4_MORIS|nr:hypothetical protein INT43_006840 [Umbelopsis isabellina]
MSTYSNELNNDGVDNRLATKSLLRYLPQLQRLQGTEGFTILTELCYYAQCHLESGWNPQNRPASLAFFRMAQHRITELTRTSSCQDMVQALHIVRGRIAAMETLMKHIDASFREHNHTWKQTLDPLIQVIREMHQLSVAPDDNDDAIAFDSGDGDDTMSVHSQCSNCDATEDEVPIFKTLHPSLIHASFYKPDSPLPICTAPESELKHEQILSESHYLSSPPAEKGDEITSPLNYKQETNDDFSDSVGDQSIDSEDESLESCSDYSPRDDRSQTSSEDNDEESSLFDHQVTLHSTANSSKTSLYDADSPIPISSNSKYDKRIVHILETMFFEVYSQRDKLTKEERATVQMETGLPSRSITYWFANHKRRYRNELVAYRKSGANSYDEYLQLRKKQKIPPKNAKRSS